MGKFKPYGHHISLFLIVNDRGVPQEYMLGPILFLILVNYIQRFIPHSSFGKFLFADYPALTVSKENEQELNKS